MKVHKFSEACESTTPSAFSGRFLGVELCFYGRVESPWQSGFEQAKALSQIERSSPELSRKLVYCRGY